MIGVVDRCSTPPEVSIVVDHPTIAIVVFPCHRSASFRTLLNQPEEWLVAFREVGDLCGPVVHLSIDVDGILAAPGRFQVLVPDPLEVCRSGAWTAGRNQKVTSVLGVKGQELRIFRRLAKLVDSLISG